MRRENPTAEAAGLGGIEKDLGKTFDATGARSGQARRAIEPALPQTYRATIAGTHLSLSSGRQLLGHLIDQGKRHLAFDPEGRLVGSFAKRQGAARVLVDARSAPAGGRDGR